MSNNPFPVTTAIVRGILGATGVTQRQQQPTYAQQQPAYAQQPVYAQQQPVYAQQQPVYAQPVSAQQPVFAQATNYTNPAQPNTQPGVPIAVTVVVQQPTPNPDDDFLVPSVISATLGYNFGPGWCIQLAAREQFNRNPGARPYYERRFDRALNTQLICCFLIAELILERLFISMLNLLIITFGSLIVALLMIPQTIAGFYSSVVCKSPRVSIILKVFAALTFPILAVISVFSATFVALFAGLCSGFVSCPRPWALGYEGAILFWQKGLAWRLEAYRQLESPEGPIYSLTPVLCCLFPVFPILGAFFGFVSYFVVAVLESPRLWYAISFRTISPTNPCYCPCMFVLPVGALFYVMALIFFGPFVGMINCFLAGCDSICRNQSQFFSDQWKHPVAFFDFIDAQCKRQLTR